MRLAQRACVEISQGRHQAMDWLSNPRRSVSIKHLIPCVHTILSSQHMPHSCRRVAVERVSFSARPWLLCTWTGMQFRGELSCSFCFFLARAGGWSALHSRQRQQTAATAHVDGSMIIIGPMAWVQLKNSRPSLICRKAPEANSDGIETEATWSDFCNWYEGGLLERRIRLLVMASSASDLGRARCATFPHHG